MKKYTFLLMKLSVIFNFALAQNAPCIHSYSERVLPTARQNQYDVKSIFFNLNVENTSTYLSGDVTTSAQIIVPQLDTFSFHLANIYTIDSIKVNNVLKNHITFGDERLITNVGLHNGNFIKVQIFYHGTVASSGNFFSGISNGTHWSYSNSNTTWTLSEPNAAYQWFPVKQVLDDKIDTVIFHATTNIGNRVGCNGVLVGIDTLPNNKVKFKWVSSKYPIAYYLISFAVANYQDYSYKIPLPGISDSLLVQNYIYNSPVCLADNKGIMDLTGEMIYFFSQLYGMYPFKYDKYGHTYAPMGGAMEHQTMTTTGYFYESIIAHELAHQWFGDLVTCASWQDIFVNESFACYSEFLWNEHKYGRSYAIASFQGYRNNVLANGTFGSVYVPEAYIDDESRIFNGTLSYNKGATVLHLLRFIAGDDNFFNIYRTYLLNHSYANGYVEDFKNAAVSVTGENFDYFFNQWIYGEGYPNFNIIYELSESKLFRLRSIETTTMPSVTPFFKVPVQVSITYRVGTVYYNDTLVYDQSSENIVFEYQLPENTSAITNVIFNPQNWLLANGTVSQGAVGISENDITGNIKIVSNPVKSSCTISFDGNINSVSIYDIAGKLIKKYNFYLENSISIDLSALQNGVYLFKIETDNMSCYKKVIKN